MQGIQPQLGSDELQQTAPELLEQQKMPSVDRYVSYVNPEIFPLKQLAQLNEKLASPRWFEMALPQGELESLLNASWHIFNIDGYYYADDDNDCEEVHAALQRSYSEALVVSFTRLLTDDELESWEPCIHKGIKRNCKRFMSLLLCYLLHQDFIPLLDVLAMMLHPDIQFHTFHAAKMPEFVQNKYKTYSHNEFYALPSSDPEYPRGWLVDLINCYGYYRGLEAISGLYYGSHHNLSLAMMYGILRPYELCQGFLTAEIIRRYSNAIILHTELNLKNIMAKDLQMEKSINLISDIRKMIESIRSRVPQREPVIETLASLKLDDSV